MLEGCFGLQAACSGCRQLQGTGILLAASHFPPGASWLTMQYQSSRSALWLLWLSVWQPQARCQCACGYEKQCPHVSLTRNQSLGSCPNNHIAGQSTCRTPFPTATAELPEPAASEGLATRGLGIPNFSSMNHPPSSTNGIYPSPTKESCCLTTERLFEPAGLLQPCTFWCLAPYCPMRDISTLQSTAHSSGMKWEGSRYFTQERRMTISVEQTRQMMKVVSSRGDQNFPVFSQWCFSSHLPRETNH